MSVLLIKTKWTLILVSVAALTSVVSAALYVNAFTAEDIGDVEQSEDYFTTHRDVTPSSSAHSVESSGVLIISTMDGKVSALDEKKGTLLWSVDAGMGPLVSSSITKLQITQDGKIIRLIPSLSGGLFRFDGKSVEALPFSADQFLSSSFRASDGSILVGDNEVTTFGLDAATGNMVYFCTAAGCESLSKASPDSHIIVVKRQQKTVRSVDNRSGQENWNFSVGEIHLDISEGASNQLMSVPQPSRLREEQNKDQKDFSASVNEFQSDNEYEDTLDEHGSGEWMNSRNLKIQVSVPDGIVSVYADDSNNKPSWKYKFPTPIANTWRVDGGQFRRVDLFDPKTVAALHQEGKNLIKDDPTIYLGFYKSHAYIQVSNILKKASGTAISVIEHISRHKTSVHPVKFSFRPYMATTNRLTEAVVGEAKEGELAIYGSSDSKGSCNDKWGVYVDTVEKGSEIGYYFKSDIPYYGLLPPSERKGKGTEIDEGNGFFQTFQIEIYPHLLHWWKEVLFISVVTSVLVHVFISKVMKNAMIAAPCEGPEAPQPQSSMQEKPDQVVSLTASTPPTQYESRYLHDFEPVRCLGKGGFGIVLESCNKVDACSYAIKRIRLPNKQSAREKVLREVRALAKLNHRCIVRYFNAWIEEPPNGWQEKVDREIIRDVCSFPSTAGMTSSHVTSKVISAKHSKHLNESKIDMPATRCHQFGDTSAFSDGSQHFSFSPGPPLGEDDWNSEDFSKISNLDGNFFQHQFSPSSEETNAFEDEKDIPFGRYNGHEDSLSILFENTGVRQSTDSAIEEDAFDKPNKHESGNGSFLKQRSSQKSSSNKKRTNSKPNNAVETAPLPNTDVNVYLYIQMELCQKESLRTWLANSHKREDHYCLWIFKHVLSAVEYVHGCSLIHRDLKPSNIFFASDGTIKVGDFGLVTESDDLCNTDFDGNQHFSEIDEAGECSHTEKVGTRLYMAPEQMNSRIYSQKVDIFALGLILIELFTPFSTQMERVNVLMQSREGKFSESFETAYHNEAELARKMLSRKPALRPTASETMEHKVFFHSTYQPNSSDS